MAVYSAREICYANKGKYIAVKVLKKSKGIGEITKAEILKVYESIEDCKAHIDELQYFRNKYKEKFDCIYGDYNDYLWIRCHAIDAFNAFGFIAFEMFANVEVEEDIEEDGGDDEWYT